jgi:translation initiation factor 2B subunit (eIF-2B alpha/beta/delta family)
MCLFAVRHVRFETMSTAQKNNLKRKLQERHKAVQARLREIKQAIAHVAKKSKGGSRGGSRRRRRR